jgi:hypothetical protein
LSIWQWIKPDVVILGIPAQSMQPLLEQSF